MVVKAKKPRYWLMKSEPDCYSIDDLERDKVEMWDGTRNYQVRNMMRDDMKVGDKALFYHSNTKEIGVVGTMTIVSQSYPDPTQFDPKSDHPDPTSDPDNPRWLCVDVRYESTFPRVVTLAEMKQEKVLSKMRTLQKGNRLSITPVSKAEYEKVVTMSKQ